MKNDYWIVILNHSARSVICFSTIMLVLSYIKSRDRAVFPFNPILPLNIFRSFETLLKIPEFRALLGGRGNICMYNMCISSFFVTFFSQNICFFCSVKPVPKAPLAKLDSKSMLTNRIQNAMRKKLKENLAESLNYSKFIIC